MTTYKTARELHLEMSTPLERAGATIRNTAVTLAAFAVVCGVAWACYGNYTDRVQRNAWLANCAAISEVFEGQMDCYLLLETGTQSLQLRTPEDLEAILAPKPSLPTYGV